VFVLELSSPSLLGLTVDSMLGFLVTLRSGNVFYVWFSHPSAFRVSMLGLIPHTL
jgi:hypothetical protein